MKKIFTLICAAVLALSASAMSNDARSLEMKHRQEVMREAMIRNNGQLPICVKAPQLKQEVINLTIEMKPTVNSYEYGNPQVYVSITSEENYGITLYINGISQLVNGQTYTLADMDNWSSIGNYNTYQYSPLSDASLTWSQDAQGLERFEGYVEDTLGNTYNFVYQEVPFAPTGDTIAVRFSKVGSFEYSTWSQYWNISGYDDYNAGNPYSVYFTLNIPSTTSPAGHFTEADFNQDGSNKINISMPGKPSKSPNFLNADITIIERNDSTLLYAYCLAEDGNVYDIYIYYSDPKPIFHKNISGTMTVDTTGIQWGSVGFKGASDDYEVSLTIWINEGDYHGTYVYPDCYPSLYNLTDSTYAQVFSGSLTITAGENGDILTGTLLCWDNTEYEIYLSEGMPEKTREEAIIMEGAGLYVFEDLHKFIVWGCSEDSSRVVSFSILSDTIDGTYTFDNLELSNTYIAYDMNPMGLVSNLFSVLDANLTVSTNEEEGTYYITGTVLAQSNYHAADVPEFAIMVKAVPAHPHLDYDTEDADFEAVYNDYELDASKLSDGYVIVTASNATSEAAIAFIIGEGATSFPAGTYTCSLKGEEMTVYTGSCDGQYVYVSYFMDKNYNLWFPYAGTATVDEEGVIVFDALNSYDRAIRVTLNPAKSAVEEVEVNAANATKRLENGLIIIEKDGVKYNVVGSEIK